MNQIAFFCLVCACGVAVYADDGCSKFSGAFSCSQVPCSYCTPGSNILTCCADACSNCKNSNAPSSNNGASSSGSGAANPSNQGSSGNGQAQSSNPAASSSGNDGETNQNAANTLRKEPSNVAPVTDEEANERFRACCNNYLEPGCLPVCKYNFSLLDLQDAFLNKKTCPLSSFNNWLYCASDGADNLKCCTDAGVFNGLPDICKTWCNQQPNLTSLNGDSLKCAAKLQQMFKCHRDNLEP